MQFSILGPLAVRDGDDEVQLGGARRRAVLVRLLVDRDRTVASDRLVEDVWDGDPPPAAASTLQSHISQLRRVIGTARVRTENGGYRLDTTGDVVDVDLFELDVDRGRRSGSAELLARAVARWRGPALADVAGTSWAAPVIARLEELKLSAVEALLDLRLREGAHADVIAEAEAAVAENPLRERTWSYLITALYRSGRQAEALRAYQRLRDHLREELGIEPSVDLRRLEGQVLAQDDELRGPRSTAAAAPDARPPAGGAPAEPSRQRALPSGLVTFLLTDVVGSTQLWDTAPTLMPDALAVHDDVLGSAVESHDGVVLKARGEGDSVFAVFGRATDAAAAAVDAQRAIARAAWPDACRLAVRMALHTGEALERDGDYYGPTVNRAARLKGLANGGQVVVSNATADVIIDHLAPELRLVELGRRQLRGLERAETVYELVDRATAPGVTAPVVSRPLEPPPVPSSLAAPGPFVGRRHELDRLAAEWARVQQGTARVAMLGGEPGVGKTRLAAEVAQRAHRDGATVLYGRCDEDLGAPYQPFAEAFRMLLPALDAALLTSIRGVEELVRLVPEITNVVPDLPAPTRSDPDTERYALFDTVTRLLVAVSGDRPVLLVLDDLHWATKPTLLMLRHVLRFGEGARVQLLGTYRTTDLDPGHPLAGVLADLHRDGTVERVMVGGLDAHDISAFLEANGHDDEELALALSTVTAGNPFFLSEVLRHVEESGGRWDPNTLPQGVREAVGRRVARLHDQTRDALLAGAVAGPRFSLEVIEKVLGRDLVDAVAEACEAGLLVEEPGGRFHFNHALVRQVLLTGVASVKRVRLHQRIAEALESAPTSQDEDLAELAHHYFESAWAGNATKAIEYCRRAGDQAMERLAYEGAAELYERALQALDAGDTTRHDEERAGLLLARCEALLAAGDAAGARDAVRDLEVAAAGSRRLSAWLACFSAELAVLSQPDRLATMEAQVSGAADDFAALDDAAGEAAAHSARASCLARLGRFAECELALDRALTAARRQTGVPSEQRRVNAVLAGAPVAALWGPSPVARAGGRCLDVTRLLRVTTRSPAVEATSTRCQAVLEAFRGRTDAARRMLESARRKVAELGLRHALLETDLYAGIVELLGDDAATAASHLRRAYDGFTRMGLDADAAEAAALLARALLALGDDDEADGLCDRSERLGGQDLRASIAWRTVRAQLFARRGDHERAREIAEDAVRLAERTDALVDRGDAQLALGLVRDLAGDHAGAHTAVEHAVSLYERKGASALAERARRLAGVASTPSRVSTAGGPGPRWLVSDAFKRHLRRLTDVFDRHGWDDAETILDADVVFQNRSRMFAPSFSGAARYAEFLRSLAEIGHRVPTLRWVASRGPRLALVHTMAMIESDGSEWSDEVLRVLELDAHDRLVADVIFDAGDLDAAYREFDSRYLRSLAADEADVFQTISAAVESFNRRDPSTSRMTPDVEAADHRPTAAAPASGAGLWSDFERTMADLPDAVLRLAAVHELGPSGAAVSTVLRGSTADGSVVETTFHGVHVVENGRITHVELFPEEALEAAVARFGELVGIDAGSAVPAELVDAAGASATFEQIRGQLGASPVDGLVSRSDVSEPDDRDNAAATAFADYHAAWGAQDWSRVEARLAEDVESDDRRAWAQLRVSGRRAHLDVLRGAIDVGASRFTCRTLATRASRVALVEVFGGGRDEDLGAPTLGVLDVVELDLHGRIAAVVIFDTDDLDAAVAELDARYIAGEAAPFAGTWAAVVDAYRRFNEGRAGNWRGGTVDVNAFADVPGVRARATVVHRLAGRGALVTATGSAPEVDDWDWLVVFDVHDNEVRGIETYPTDEFDAALARFEALVASG